MSITQPVCVCVCVCSLKYPACNAHAPPYCYLWPAPLYNIFPHYLINGTIFEKKYVFLLLILQSFDWLATFYLQLLQAVLFAAV